MQELEDLSRLLDRRVAELVTERAPGIALERRVGVRFEDGVEFMLPRGNALRTAADFAEVRLLLAGFSRDLARLARTRMPPGDALPALQDLEALMEEVTRDADGAAERWQHG